MTFYISAYMVSLSLAILSALIVGDRNSKINAGALFLYWACVWIFISGNPHTLALNNIAAGLLWLVSMKWPVRHYAKWLIGTYILLFAIGGFAVAGLLSTERGLGLKAATYWNFRAWILHGACWILILPGVQAIVAGAWAMVMGHARRILGRGNTVHRDRDH